MRLFNKTRQSVVASRVDQPATLIGRMRGLLGRSQLEPGEGMLLTDCGWVHTFFMRFTIDVLFLNNEFQVLKTVKNLKPNRLSPICFGAAFTLELPADTIATTATAVGDQLTKQAGDEHQPDSKQS